MSSRQKKNNNNKNEEFFTLLLRVYIYRYSNNNIEGCKIWKSARIPESAHHLFLSLLLDNALSIERSIVRGAKALEF